MKNKGFRFFRDDFILSQYETRIQCSRCDAWMYPDEVDNNMYDENICEKCRNTVAQRLRSLQRDVRKRCPIDSGDWIFSTEDHRHPAYNRDRARH